MPFWAAGRSPGADALARRPALRIAFVPTERNRRRSGHGRVREVMSGSVDLYWIPLGAGAGGAVVRWSGRLYEAVAAALARRRRCALFHSALEVGVNGVTAVIEMAPVWTKRGDRGV